MLQPLQPWSERVDGLSRGCLGQRKSGLDHLTRHVPRSHPLVAFSLVAR